jgi:glycosyl transferase family 87
MQEKPRELHYLAKALILAIPAISIGIQIPTWMFAFSEYKNRLDFFAYYEAGYFLRTAQASRFYQQTRPPSFGFIHPAYEALVFFPLSFLAPRMAYIVWIVVGLVIVWLILRNLKSEIECLYSFSVIMPWALTFAFFPVSYAIDQGQDSLILALLVVLAFKQVKTGKNFHCGLLLGLGMFRFQVLVPIAILFLFWKSWKLLGGIFASTVVALCASLAITGISGQLQYLRLLHLLADPANQNLKEMSNLRSVLAALGTTSSHVVLGLSALVLIILSLAGQKLTEADRFLFAVTGGCLLSYHLFIHDFCLLLLPLLVVTNLSVKRVDYLGLSFAAVIILLPEVAITVGSATALWACALIPVLLLIFMLRNRAQHKARALYV